jgi:hypothetical protein
MDPGMGGGPGGPMPMMPGMVAGMTAPEYGMPITGTPIGLPGAPHIPLGVPAGLQKHVVKNHTFQKIPHPDKKIKIHVKQTPGLTYPKPANHTFIHEHAMAPLLPLSQPLADRMRPLGVQYGVPMAPPPGTAGPMAGATDCPPQ